MRPSEYFKQRLEQHGEHVLKEILKSHIIPEDALQDLLHDDIRGFMEKRKEAIIGEIRTILM